MIHLRRRLDFVVFFWLRFFLFTWTPNSSARPPRRPAVGSARRMNGATANFLLGREFLAERVHAGRLSSTHCRTPTPPALLGSARKRCARWPRPRHTNLFKCHFQELRLLQSDFFVVAGHTLAVFTMQHFGIVKMSPTPQCQDVAPQIATDVFRPSAPPTALLPAARLRKTPPSSAPSPSRTRGGSAQGFSYGRGRPSPQLPAAT